MKLRTWDELVGRRALVHPMRMSPVGSDIGTLGRWLVEMFRGDDIVLLEEVHHGCVAFETL